MRIDAHQHFWHFDPVRDSWINEEMQAIQCDFLPADLQPVLAQHGFDGCVAVQADQSEAQNDYLLQLAEGNAFIKGIVGWVDLQADNCSERLQHYRRFPLVKGFRHVLQGEADRALMLQPAFQKGIAALGAAGYTYDILIFPDQLGYSAELVAAFPGQPFVVDHIAKPLIKDAQLDGWKRDMEALAEHPNVCCKVSGMVTEADWKAWRYEDFVPYLDTVVGAFGMERLMYGSDWPVCNVAGGYEAMLGIVQRYFNSFSASEQEAFWGGNATRFYNL